MQPSKYLSHFLNATKEAKDSYVLTGDFLLVENIPQEEIKRASGIIVPINPLDRNLGSIGANLPTFVHVLAIGEGYYDDETKESVALSTKPGDILLVGNNSVKWFPVMELDGYKQFDVGLTREAETQLRFKGIEGYRKFIEALHRGT